MLALDITPGLVKAALSSDVQMVVTHHPVIFHPLENFLFSSPVPRLVMPFLEHGIAVASAHTNLDAVAGGVNDVLADIAGMTEREPVIPASGNFPGAGIGRIGHLARPVAASDFLEKLCADLQVKDIRVAGNIGKDVFRVAVCSGSGSGIWPHVIDRKPDIFITGEVKHNIAVEADLLDIIVADAGHWATEHPVIPALAHRIRNMAADRGWQLETVVFASESDPFNMISF
jgi:dinuclear metal center YbgI/SA1388 family protein